MVGISGKSCQRALPVTARALTVPALMWGCAGCQHARTELNRPAHQRFEGIAAAGKHHRCHSLQAFAQLEHFGLELRGGADRWGRNIELVGTGLGERDELFHDANAQIGPHRKHVWRYRELAYRREIVERIIGQRLIKAGVDGVGAGREQDGVAVGLGAGDHRPIPILPPAPPLFSTITLAPIASCIAAAMKRAMMSEGPPGVFATTILIGRSG
jgi:hypothetical protein